MATVPCPDSTGTAGEVKKIILTPFLPLFCLLFCHAPMKVKSVCLPFVFVKLPDGRHRTLDVRQHQLAEVSRDYGRSVFDAARDRRKRRAKKRRNNSA